MYKEFFQKNKRILIMLTIGLFLYSSILFIYLYRSIDSQNKLYETESALIIHQYEDIMENSLMMTNSITAYVTHQSETEFIDSDLNSYLENQDLEQYGIEFVLFSPASIVEYVYPIENQEHLIGFDMLAEAPEIAVDAILDSIENDIIVIHSRRQTQTGIYGVVLRRPVYYLNGDYYGLVTIIIDQAFMEEQALVKNNYYFENALFDPNNDNIIGNVEYDPLFDIYEQLSFENTSLFVGMNLSNEYKNEIIIERTLVIGLLTILFLAGGHFLASYAFYNSKHIKKIEVDLITDTLSNLYNRKKLIDDTDKLIKEEKGFTILLGDLVKFKEFNDMFGHSIGDKVIIEIAKVLIEFESSYSTVYRWGGDEFAILLETDEQIVVSNFVTDLKAKLRKPILLEKIEYEISIKIGVSRYPEDADNLEEMIKLSDSVIRNTKDKNNIVIEFVGEDTIDDLNNKFMLSELIRKKTLSSFNVYLQPIVNVETNKLFGFEALLRVFDEDDKKMNTQDVIEILEKQGNINELDKFVFETICGYSKILEYEFKKLLNISFNISALSLNEDFVNFVEGKVFQAQCDPKSISIEITESVGIVGIANVKTYMTRLKNLGFRIVIDDFGMGYSSLSYISTVPFSILKIDKKFIQSSENNEMDRKLVEIIVNLSKSMDFLIVAEGVETKAQLDYCKSLKCDYYQGYLYGRAKPLNKILKLIKDKTYE